MKKMDDYVFEEYIIPQGAGDSFRTALTWYKAAAEKMEAPIRLHNVVFSCVLTLALSISYVNGTSAFDSEKALLKAVRKFLVPEGCENFLFCIQNFKQNESAAASDEFILLCKEFILINDYDTDKGYSLAFMVLHILEDFYE